MNERLTDSDFYARQGAIFDLVSDFWVRLDADIRAGIFDDDAQARREAEELLEETDDFYGSLLTV